MSFTAVTFLTATVIILTIQCEHATFPVSSPNRNAEYRLSFKPTIINDNTSLYSPQKKRQSLFAPNFIGNGQSHLSALSNLMNLGSLTSVGPMGGLRTVMMGGMLYGLSLLPAVVMALGGSNLPMGGLLSSLGLNRRALPETSSANLPILSESETRNLLVMLQQAFKLWNVADEHCKQLFVCQMYRQVSNNGVTPDLDLFKEALLQILERGGKRRPGRGAQLLLEYEHYFDAARMGMEQDECETHYPSCELSLYPGNRGFEKKSKKTSTEK